MAELYESNGRLARDSAPAREIYVKAAFNVFNICLNMRAQFGLARCIGTSEVCFGQATCFNDMTSFATSIARLESIIDSAWVCFLQNDDLAPDARASSHTVTSHCSRWQFWWQVLNRYLHLDVQQLGVRSADLQTMRTVRADNDSYRKAVYGVQEAVGTRWTTQRQQSRLVALAMWLARAIVRG